MAGSKLETSIQRALASTIGTDVKLDGFEPGLPMSSSWVKEVQGYGALPFNGD